MGKNKNLKGLDVALFCIFSLIILGLVYPFNFSYLAPGLDPSWAAVVSEAQKLGLAFGQDIIFTAGPLTSAYHKYFSESNAFFIVIIWLVYCIYVAYSLLWLIQKSQNKALFAILTLLILTTVSLSRDSLMVWIPFLFLNLYSLGLTSIVYVGISCALSAAFALAKFSVFPLALLAALIGDGVALTNRKIPYITILFLALMAVFFVLSGENLRNFLPFLQGSWEVSSGYSAAMGLEGNPQEFRIWVLIGGFFVGVVIADVLQSLRLDEREKVIATLARASVLAAFLWIGLKAGFVRHDLHSQIAWTNLILGLLIYVIARSFSFQGRRRILLLLSLMGISIVLANGLPYGNMRASLSSFTRPIEVISSSWTQSRLGLKLLANPPAWLKEQMAIKEQSFATIQAEYPLPALEGTVDMIPFYQSEILANRLNYRPRPTIQEYTTYTSFLIQKNADFLSGQDAPEYLFFAPGSIDSRHPASPEGSLWPLLLSRYEPVDQVRDMLLLRQRSTPLGELLSSSQEYTTDLGQTLAIPPATEPLFVKISVEYTSLGKLTKLLFKPPEISFKAVYDNGTEGIYKLIPEMAAAGMVLSPLVSTPDSYLALATGYQVALSKPPIKATSLQILTSPPLGSWMYKPAVKVTLSTINSNLLREKTAIAPPIEKIMRSIERVIQQRNDLLGVLLSNNVLTPPLLELSDEGIFAHAESKLKLPVEPGAKVEVGFGIRDGAWQEGRQTNGVCFVAKISGSEQTIWERCLDPQNIEADRGNQIAIFDLPPEATSIDLITSCREDCSWDWSYWSQAIVRKSDEN